MTQVIFCRKGESSTEIRRAASADFLLCSAAIALFIGPDDNDHALLAESSAVDDFDRHEMIEMNYPDRALRPEQ